MFYPENGFYKKSILLKRILKSNIISFGNEMQCIIFGGRNVSKIISLQVLKITKIHSTKKARISPFGKILMFLNWRMNTNNQKF